MKRTLLTASAIAVAATASAHAAAPAPQLSAPTELAAPVAHAGDEAQSKPALVRNVGLAAAATAALGAIVQLFGAGRIAAWFRAAAPAAKKAAEAAARAPVAAARAVGRAAATPLRFALWAGGLGLFALAGLNLFNVEWAGGLVAGGAIVALLWIASTRSRRALEAVRRRRSDAHKR